MTDKTPTIDNSRRRFLTVVGSATLGMTSSVAAQTTTSHDHHQGGDHQLCCFRFGGRVAGWQGRWPQSIAGQKNPRLQLEPRTTYGVMWKNLDGQPHTFALRDSNGNNLPVILPTVRTMQHGGQMMGGRGTNSGGHQGTMMGGDQGTMMGGENGPMMGGRQGREKPPKDAIKVTPQVAKKGAVQMLAFVATRDITQYLCTIHPTTMIGDVTIKEKQGGSGDGNGQNHGHDSGNNGNGHGGS